MIYRVLDNAHKPVRWPNGQIRAEAGQVFDGFDVHGTPEYVVTSRWLGGQRAVFAPAPGESPNAGQDMPEEHLAKIREVREKAGAGGAAYATRVAKPAPAPKPAPKEDDED